MTGDNQHKFEVTARLAWTKGTLKAVVAAVLAAVGGLWHFWEPLTSWLSSAPVWAFAALLALSCSPFSVIAAPSTESPYPTVYGNPKGEIQCAL